MNSTEIRRLDLGWYTMPAASRLAGQKVVLCAYLIRYPGGLLLFDTGLRHGHAQTDEEFAPVLIRPLTGALAEAGVTLSDITAVANCHLHIDHCGGNPQFAGTPIFVQQRELDALPELDYVLPEMVEFDGVLLAVHDGTADVGAGVQIVPTPGHTPGHQSVLVQTGDGPVLLAGQAFDSASDFGRALLTIDVLAASEEAEAAASVPPWLSDLRELELQRVLFAHDTLTYRRADRSS